ncbi:MAG TPA: MmcQ/YjbR family DNA-binding protein [Solirubrobacteraceae bacterium]|nr:MmcQ/YjbR family DNA-binding protein [Solirubrobacteraceae bacterium]
MSGWEDVRRIALSLPGSEERRSRERLQWRVGGKLFVWERPLREKEVLELGAEATDGPVMGARVEHLIAKEALLAEDPALFFTTSHFKGSAAVLVRLDRIGAEDLEEVVTEAWFARAPSKLAAAEAQRLRGRD